MTGQQDANEGRSRSSTELRETAAGLVDEIVETLVETADPKWGGWGARQKFPHPDALHFLLVRGAATGRDDLVRLVTHTLASMLGSEIHDSVEGGFYRFATQPDWSVPVYEKPLLSNAKRLLALAETFQVVGDLPDAESFKDAAHGVAAWMRQVLLDPQTGAFRNTQDADPEYARLKTAQQRKAHGTPPIDPKIYADRNAWATIGFLKAGFVFESGSMLETGMGTLQFILTRLFDDAQGMSHQWNGSPSQPGELVDQATTLRAIVEASHVGTSNEYLETGARIALLTDEKLSREDGSFRSHPFQDAGAPMQSDDLRANAVMAEALIRFGILYGAPHWVRRGERALAAFTSSWRPHGFASAGYGRALDLVARPPVHVVVVGSALDERTRPLADAARRSYVASRIAQTVDPSSESELLGRLGIEVAFDGPFARVSDALGEIRWVGTDPNELGRALTTFS